MKKIHLIGLAAIAVLAFSALAVASASATTLVWLANGKKIEEALKSETVGEIELFNLETAVGTKATVLCSGTFMGTVGPGGEDLITSVLTLASEGSVEITLAAPLTTCTNVEGCSKPQVAPVNLPWLTELELMEPKTGEVLFLDIITSGGAGEPGWEIMCEPLGILFEETCTGTASSMLENDAAENDVLGKFEGIAEEAAGETGVCKTGGKKVAGVNSGATDETGLLTLENGEPLSLSYE